MLATDSRFMVMGLKRLFLRDLVETMKEAFPALEACTASTEAEAIAQTTGQAGCKNAFLNFGPVAFEASALSQIFNALGTKIILLGNAAEDAAVACPYSMLERSFMADDILGLRRQKP